MPSNRKPSLKHSRIFAYKRHNKVFDNIEAEVNHRELNRTIRALCASNEHVELRSPKRFAKTDRTRPNGNTVCYSLTWYTRQDMGPKNAAA